MTFHHDGLYNPLACYEAKCLTELLMLKMSQAIRSKPNWHEKIWNSRITGKWKAEAEANGLSSEAADYVIEEVQHFSTLKAGPIEPGPVQGVWVADDLIDDVILTRFKQLVAVGLENIPEEEKDFHPGSDNLVVDLLHPSLYCFVQDKSKLVNTETISKDFLPENCPTVVEIPANRPWLKPVKKPSGKYRWLPSEVRFDKNNSLSFDSYINNLHPIKHKELYGVLAEILTQFIPMFNRALTDICNWKDDVFNSAQWHKARWQKNDWSMSFPRVPHFEPKTIHYDTYIFLEGEPLQVIVKLANIELTQEKPEYTGGTWHVEGIEEERIVATGIYYYEMHNITDSKLVFRHSINQPEKSQYDQKGMLEHFGFNDRDPLNQILGSFTAKAGRCIVFPNVYQHRVAPFELADKTKPGFRKILVFFLIDPKKKVISTHNVLPQQPDWKDIKSQKKDRQIITRKEAESFREKLMFERRYVGDEYQKEFFEREFSLCEH